MNEDGGDPVASPATLDYASAPRRCVSWRSPFVVVCAAGALYWCFADWWVYIGDGATARPKFKLPLWWQLLESSLVGLVVARVVRLIAFAVHRPRTTRGREQNVQQS